MCSLRLHTPWLVAACRLLQSGNSPSVDACIYLNFRPLRMRTLAKLSAGKGSSVFLILHPASHQSAKSRNSLVLLQLRWRQPRSNRSQHRSSHQQPRLTETTLPPHSDWVANYMYRPTYVSVSVDLTLASCVYRTTHRARWQCGGRRSL